MPSKSHPGSGGTTASTSSNSVTIRRFVPTDGPAVAQLITGILGSEYPADQAAYPPADLQAIEKTYGGPQELFLVAEHQGRIVGTCGVKSEGHAALLRRLFVAPQHRGRGLGSKLVDAAIAHCRTNGYREVRIRTSDRMSAAIAMCLQKGFRENEQIHLGPVQLIRFSLRM